MEMDFLEFLAAERVLTPDQAARVRERTGKMREPIGSIAFSYGLVSGDDVDLILSEQRREHRPFGEIAAAMGVLTRVQVEALVRVQQVRSAVETAEALVLADAAPPGAVFGALGRFLGQESQSSGARRQAA